MPARLRNCPLRSACGLAQRFGVQPLSNLRTAGFDEQRDLLSSTWVTTLPLALVHVDGRRRQQRNRFVGSRLVRRRRLAGLQLDPAAEQVQAGESAALAVELGVDQDPCRRPQIDRQAVVELDSHDSGIGVGLDHVLAQQAAAFAELQPLFATQHPGLAVDDRDDGQRGRLVALAGGLRGRCKQGPAGQQEPAGREA